MSTTAFDICKTYFDTHIVPAIEQAASKGLWSWSAEIDETVIKNCKHFAQICGNEDLLLNIDLVKGKWIMTIEWSANDECIEV